MISPPRVRTAHSCLCLHGARLAWAWPVPCPCELRRLVQRQQQQQARSVVPAGAGDTGASSGVVPAPALSAQPAGSAPSPTTRVSRGPPQSITTGAQPPFTTPLPTGPPGSATTSPPATALIHGEGAAPSSADAWVRARRATPGEPAEGRPSLPAAGHDREAARAAEGSGTGPPPLVETESTAGGARRDEATEIASGSNGSTSGGPTPVLGGGSLSLSATSDYLDSLSAAAGSPARRMVWAHTRAARCREQRRQ